MTDVLVKLASSGKRVHAVTEGLAEDSGYVLSGADEHHDPHVWMDPRAWQRATEVVFLRLSEFDPAGRSVYENNKNKYIQSLEDLDLYAKQVLSSIPKESRVLVSAHDAFNYFGRAYNFEVLGIQGISTESEAGVRDIENLVRKLVDHKIRAVFIETTVSDRSIKALIEGAKAQGHQVSLGGSLYSDAMGNPNSYEGTYLGMIDHNVTIISRALGGNAPAKGRLGRLEIE